MPALWVDRSDDEERLVLATLDPLGALAETNRDALSSLLGDLAERGDALGAMLDGLQVRRYHRFKAENGYTSDEIDRKRLALEGIQVPITAAWNEDLLRGAGFRDVDCFWRWENFGAWVAVKG